MKHTRVRKTGISEDKVMKLSFMKGCKKFFKKMFNINLISLCMCVCDVHVDVTVLGPGFLEYGSNKQPKKKTYACNPCYHHSKCTF